MKVHFIGIGGIGVSALARYYLAKGWQVSGSDLVASEITQKLESDGVVFFVNHDVENIPTDVDKIIYSAAVKNGNPELIRARNLEIPTLSYAEALGELTKQYLTIAVSGSHGKSTTTALLSLMLIKAGLDPTVIIGTRLKEFKGKNFRLGKSRYLVIEADEWNNSFHHYFPTIAVLTNVDKEHLDTFKNLRGVISGFKRYLSNIAPYGKVFINAKDKNSLAAVKKCSAEMLLYNLPRSKAGRKAITRWPLKIFGDFNQLNAEAAWQAAHCLGVSKKIAKEAVRNYQGSWRRMEFLAPKTKSLLASQQGGSDYTFIADYAHHPNEIKAVGRAMKKKFPKKKRIVIFQPHQVERLTNLFKDFTDCFSGFNIIGVLPTYEVKGRELKGGKSSLDLVKRLKKGRKSVYFLKNFEEALTLTKEFKQEKPVVVFMGAGDIDSEVRNYFKSKLF